MAGKKHKVTFYIWAVYYGGKFSSYSVSDTDMSMQTGWIRVKDMTHEFEHDEFATPDEVIMQLRAEIDKMRAAAEMAIQEKIDTLNKLLAIANEVPQ